MEYLEANGSYRAREILEADELDTRQAVNLLRSLVRTRNFTSAVLILQCHKCGHREEWGPREDRFRCPVIAQNLRRCKGLLWPPREVWEGLSLLSPLSQLSNLHQTSRFVLDAFDRLGPETTTKELLEATGMPRSTLHSHLTLLGQAGQVTSVRQGYWSRSEPQA